MSDSAFIDTNILVYAHDQAAGPKYETAANIVRMRWQDQNGVLSTQVLQEFFVTLTRKVTPAMSPAKAGNLIRHYSLWQVVINDVAAISNAIEIQQEYQLSFWDSLIIDAASNAGCSTLITEDLNHEQVYRGVAVINPFISAS